MNAAELSPAPSFARAAALVSLAVALGGCSSQSQRSVDGLTPPLQAFARAFYDADRRAAETAIAHAVKAAPNDTYSRLLHVLYINHADANMTAEMNGLTNALQGKQGVLADLLVATRIVLYSREATRALDAITTFSGKHPDRYLDRLLLLSIQVFNHPPWFAEVEALLAADDKVAAVHVLKWKALFRIGKLDEAKAVIDRGAQAVPGNRRIEDIRAGRTHDLDATPSSVSPHG